ncbi:MAG: FliH/SctL family protein [Candidatus Margulisiibacteriota bacterium]
MALIKKSKIIEKGFVDIGQASPNMSYDNSVQEEEKISPQDTYIEQELSPPIDNSLSDEEKIESAYEKASKIIEQAQSEVQEMMENAQSEAETLRESAKAEGLEEGKREGEAQISEAINQALETLNEAIKQRKKIIKDAESEIVRLSLKIAEQIIRSEVSVNKDAVMNIVAEAINKVSDRENVIVKVNRDDAEYIKTYKEKLAGIVDGVKNLSILEDSQVEPGGCVVETNLGFVDARISTKISLIEQAIGKAQESDSD